MEDHFEVYKKQVVTLRDKELREKDVLTHMYRQYIPTESKIDPVVEYFKFEKIRERGFSNPFLKSNPYEFAFNAWLDGLESEHKDKNPYDFYMLKAQLLAQKGLQAERELVTPKSVGRRFACTVDDLLGEKQSSSEQLRIG